MPSKIVSGICVTALAAMIGTACASRRTAATGGTAPAPTTTARNETDQRLQAAATVLNEIMAVPEKAIPNDLLERAHCVAIIPGMKKAALGIGAQYGKGFLTCRQPNGGWTAPGAVRIEGGSFGLQLGAQESDVVMLIMNQRGEDRVLASQFTLGGEASVAAGPVGRHTGAQTDAYMTAEILSWARSRGAFAGISLNGSTLREDLVDNMSLYGKQLTNRDVIQGKVPVPAAAKALIAELSKYSSQEKS